MFDFKKLSRPPNLFKYLSQKTAKKILKKTFCLFFSLFFKLIVPFDSIF